MTGPPIVVVSGAVGAGKTTVAQALLRALNGESRSDARFWRHHAPHTRDNPFFRNEVAARIDGSPAGPAACVGTWSQQLFLLEAMRQADPPDDKDDVAGVLLEYWPVDSVRVMARWQRHQDDDIYALDAVLQRWASETGVMDRVCAFILVEADEPTCHHRVLQRGRPDERYQRKDFNKLAAEYRRLYALRPASGLARRRGARVWRACRSIERSLPQAIAEPYSRAHRRGGIPLWIWSNPDGSAPSDVAGTSALLKCLRSSEPE